MSFKPLFAAIVLLPIAAQAQEARTFNRIATIEAVRMLPPDRDKVKRSIAEIVAASEDGNTLVYVDGEQNGLGFVDIRDPAAPRPAGFLAMSGELTSVTVRGPRAYAVSDTSPNKREPSGYAAVVELSSRREVMRCELGGQPDATVVSRDGRFLVVVIENERDERLNRGEIPQLPPGNLTIVPITNRVSTAPVCGALTSPVWLRLPRKIRNPNSSMLTPAARLSLLYRRTTTL